MAYKVTVLCADEKDAQELQMRLEAWQKGQIMCNNFNAVKDILTRSKGVKMSTPKKFYKVQRKS